MIHSIRSFIKMLRLPPPDYELHCRNKRLERYEKRGGYIHNLLLHSIAYYMILPLIKANLFLTGRRRTVIRDERKKTNRPIIFCPTHIGGQDIEMSFVSIHTPCWLVLGNPHELYKNINGMMLQMCGLIPFDLLVKPDRTVAKAQMKALLQKHGRLWMYPEGIQNISPNALVGRLYAGAVDLAISCNAEIIPVAIGRDNNHYYLIIGENMCYDDCNYEDRFNLTDALRDCLASLKWEIIERLPPIVRKELSAFAYDDYVKNVITMNTTYTLTVEDIRAEQFHPKDVTEPEDAFAHLNKLIPCRENAFLFNKRLSPAGKVLNQ